MKRLASAVVALLLVFGLAQAARADSITFTINNPSQSGVRGTTFSYSATVTAASNNTGPEYLNGLSFNLGPSNAFVVNQDPFFNNYPFFLLAGQSYTGTLFTLSVPLSSTIGVFTGTISLLGGTSSGTGVLGTQAFAVTVTPEPSTWALLATGMVGVFVLARRTRLGETVSFRA